MRRLALCLLALAGSFARPVVADDLEVPREPERGMGGMFQPPPASPPAPLPCEPLGGASVEVLLTHAEGYLIIAVEVAEPPGPSVGVVAMLASESEPKAVTVASFRPQDVRGARYSFERENSRARGADFAGTFSMPAPERWKVVCRLAIPPGVGSGSPALRMALAITGRVPNRVAFAPPGSAFSSPGSWARLVPVGSAWETRSGSTFVAERRSLGEDEDDARRLAAWREHLVERVRGGPSDGARARLVGPLDKAIAARPDLVMLHVVKGDTLRDLGDLDAAQAAYDEALKVGPHFPEARWARERLRAIRWLERKPGDPSDYDAAFAAIASGAKEAPEGSPAPALADGVLRYRAGEFEEAARRLAPFAATHAFDEEVVEAHRLAEQGRQAWSAELGFRRASERKEPLPRVRLTTSKGAVLVELFEDHAPNAVASFVWLAKHGFYDGTRVGGTTPFSAVRLGDPRTRPGAPEDRSDGPGWATAAEPSPRKGLRGMLATDADTSGAAGSRFLVLTGTTAFDPGRATVFGRVLEGQDVVERLAAGDALEKVEVVRTREHEYRPTTLAGEPAPAPK